VKRQATLIVAIAALGSAGCSTPAGAAALHPPPGFMSAVRHEKASLRDCPADAPPYTAVLDFPSKYEGSDKARDDLNPKAEREYRRRIAPITAFERGVSRQVDDYLRGGKPEALDCALQLLHAWSRADALENEAKTHTGKSMRKWTLSSVASSYVRLKFSSSQPLREIDPAMLRDIEAWLARMGERVVADWRDQPVNKINNHEYWAAWAVTATAIALDRRDLFDWGLSQYRVATTQIDERGFLPNELARDTRALYYHNYALAPLAMIAAFAQTNGIDVTTANDHAVERLARRVLSGIDDPQAFEDRTGDEQLVDELEEHSKLAWLEPYCWTFACDADLSERLEDLRPLKSTRLGGNVSELFSIRPDHPG
jgi:poly(beta-D-mannuronate) lyase